MSYIYAEQKPKLFTEEMQVKFLELRDKVRNFLSIAGAFRMSEAMARWSGDSWMCLA